jgi:hypothetical protein
VLSLSNPCRQINIQRRQARGITDHHHPDRRHRRQRRRPDRRLQLARHSYEIDLSKKNLDKLIKALQPYTTAARRTGGRRSRTGRTTRSGADPDQLAKIRDLARNNGHQVSDRGRISAAVQEAYYTAN